METTVVSSNSSETHDRVSRDGRRSPFSLTVDRDVVLTLVLRTLIEKEFLKKKVEPYRRDPGQAVVNDPKFVGGPSFRRKCVYRGL